MTSRDEPESTKFRPHAVLVDAELGTSVIFSNSERILLECFMCILIILVDPSAVESERDNIRATTDKGIIHIEM